MSPRKEAQRPSCAQQGVGQHAVHPLPAATSVSQLRPTVRADVVRWPLVENHCPSDNILHNHGRLLKTEKCLSHLKSHNFSHLQNFAHVRSPSWKSSAPDQAFIIRQEFITDHSEPWTRSFHCSLPGPNIMWQLIYLFDIIYYVSFFLSFLIF